MDLLRKLGEEYDFRLIVDDGSHKWAHQISTFETMLPSMPPQAIYICEDLLTSYGLRMTSLYGDDGESAAEYFLRIARRIIGGPAPRSAHGDSLKIVLEAVHTIAFIYHAALMLTR